MISLVSHGHLYNTTLLWSQRKVWGKYVHPKFGKILLIPISWPANRPCNEKNEAISFVLNVLIKCDVETSGHPHCYHSVSSQTSPGSYFVLCTEVTWAPPLTHTECLLLSEGLLLKASCEEMKIVITSPRHICWHGIENLQLQSPRNLKFRTEWTITNRRGRTLLKWLLTIENE